MGSAAIWSIWPESASLSNSVTRLLHSRSKALKALTMLHVHVVSVALEYSVPAGPLDRCHSVALCINSRLPAKKKTARCKVKLDVKQWTLFTAEWLQARKRKYVFLG